MLLPSFFGEFEVKAALDVLKLSAIGVGMAITISCNTVLVSLFSFTSGGSLLLAIGIAGLSMAVIALCFCELASKFPGAIGIRAFTKSAFGNRFSIGITLFYVLMVALIGGLEVYLCHLLLLQLLPFVWATVILIVLVAFVVIVNLNGYELSLQLQILMTVTVALMMVALSTVAISESIPADSITIFGANEAVPKNDLLNAIPRALFLFVGIEWAVIHVTKHQMYQRTLPVALLLGVLIIGLLYAQFSVALSTRFHGSELQGELLPHLSLAFAMHSVFAKILVVFISVLAVLSSFNVGLSGAARILYSLARERELPKWFAQMHPTKFIPQNAIFAVVTFVLLFAPIMSIPELNQSLSQLLSFHLVLVYASVLFAWLTMRHKRDSRGVKVRLHQFIVWPVSLFLVLIGVGLLIEPSGAVMRWIVFFEISLLSVVCVFLFRLRTIKIEG